MITTGKHSQKPYKCSKCGHEEQIGTNHWGECYSFGRYNKCPKCPPMECTVWKCQEMPPEGMGVPEKTTRILGD